MKLRSMGRHLADAGILCSVGLLTPEHLSHPSSRKSWYSTSVVLHNPGKSDQ